MASPYGLDTPSGSGHGYAPYEEAAAKSNARMHAYRMALAGLGGISVPQGANFGEAFISSLSGSARASSAAQQAAEAYAMKKIEAERAQEERQARLGLIEAQTAKASRPEPPPKSQFGNKPWYENPALANDPNAIAARRKATYIAPAKPEKPPKPQKVRPAVQNLLDAIQTADPNNPEHRARLEGVIANPLTPEIGEAARARLRIGGKEFYRFQPVGPDSSSTGGLRYR